MSKKFFDQEFRRWRKLKKLNQRRCADLLEVGIVTIWRWEKGIQKPSRLALNRLKQIGFFWDDDER